MTQVGAGLVVRAGHTRARKTTGWRLPGEKRSGSTSGLSIHAASWKFASSDSHPGPPKRAVGGLAAPWKWSPYPGTFHLRPPRRALFSASRIFLAPGAGATYEVTR